MCAKWESDKIIILEEGGLRCAQTGPVFQETRRSLKQEAVSRSVLGSSLETVWTSPTHLMQRSVSGTSQDNRLHSQLRDVFCVHF